MFTNDRATKYGELHALSPTCSKVDVVFQYDWAGNALFTVVHSFRDDPAEGAVNVGSI